MKSNELRAKSVSDLKKLLNEKLHEQFNLRMQKGSGQPVQVGQLKSVKTEIARIKTIIHQKQGEAA
jgi:large subunit ribosomal protein L29